MESIGGINSETRAGRSGRCNVDAGRFSDGDLRLVKSLLRDGYNARRCNFNCTLRIRTGRQSIHLTCMYDYPRAMRVFTIEETNESFGVLPNAVFRAVELAGRAWAPIS